MDRVTDSNAFHLPMEEDERPTRFAQWKSRLEAESHVLIKAVGSTITASWSVTNTGAVVAFGALDIVFPADGGIGFFGSLVSIPAGATVTLSVSGIFTALSVGTHTAEVRVKAAAPATVAPGGVHPFTVTITAGGAILKANGDPTII